MNSLLQMVIFGATGDLVHRKLMPALFSLFSAGHLPSQFEIIGFSRRDLSDHQYREMMAEVIWQHFPQAQTEQVRGFINSLQYQAGYFDQPDGYASLAERIGFRHGRWSYCANRMYYLATPPQHYYSIIEHLYQHGLAQPCSEKEGEIKILIEKPFGRDTVSARRLDALLGKWFAEQQIFRIDHYLGKESIQNILMFRFSNTIFEPIWNKQYVKYIHIRMWEQLGLEGRGGFYDQIGALRDTGQNHLLMMLALVTMDLPSKFSPVAIRRSRHEVLKTLNNIPDDQIRQRTFRAQYVGYRQEPGVEADSETETYFRLWAEMGHPRWEGVPIILEGGKKLSQTLTEIAIGFCHPTRCFSPRGQQHDCCNRIVFRLKPQEEIKIKFWMKKPGLNLSLESRDLSFDYHTGFDERLPRAYEKVLLDAIKGDQTLFTSTAELLDSWDFISQVLQAWKNNLVPLSSYQPGTLPANEMKLPVVLPEK